MPLSIPCGWREREEKKKHRLDRTSSIDAQIMDVGDAPSYGSDKMGWSTTALRRSCVWALSDYFAFHSRSRNLWDPFNRARVLFRCSTWSRALPFNFHFKVVFCVGSDPTLVQGWVRMGSVRVDSLLSHESLKTWNGQSGPFHVWGFALYHSLYYTESQDWLRLFVGTDIKAMPKSQTIDN